MGCVAIPQEMGGLPRNGGDRKQLLADHEAMTPWKMEKTEPVSDAWCSDSVFAWLVQSYSRKAQTRKFDLWDSHR